MAQHVASPNSTSTADALRAELAPSGILQRLVVDQIALGTDRLARAAALEDPADPANPAWLRYQAQAERTFYRALAEFRRLVKAESRSKPTGKATAKVLEVITPPAPPVVAPRPPRAPGDWRSRVDRGPAGDFRWPVLTGTAIKVDDIISLLGEGWSEAELLSKYPELIADDMEVSRECEAEGAAGPHDPPSDYTSERPPGLAPLRPSG